MNRFLWVVTCILFFCTVEAKAQFNETVSYDSLKRAMIQMDKELYQVQLNLHQSQKQLKTGILVATLGYTVTIIGGQLLGTQPEIGEALLYVGGATGIVGTVVLFNGFKKISLGPPVPR